MLDTIMLLRSAFVILITLTQSVNPTVLQWDWNNIPHRWEDVKKIDFTQGASHAFAWGVGDSAFQTEGPFNGKEYVESNWSQHTLKSGDTIASNLEKFGKGCDRWQRWKEDIDRVVACGFTSYRMSIDWSKLEPRKGEFDNDVMQHYVDVCTYARDRGLSVMVVLWHFVQPLWFEEQGGFEHEEHIYDFVRFCNYACLHLSPYVHSWSPLNEPEAYAMAAYFTGEFPPKKKNLHTAGTVLKHLLQAHVLVSEVIKSYTPAAQVGIIKVIALIDPYYSLHPIEWSIARFFDGIVNDAVIEFFSKGHFYWYFPGVVNVKLDEPKAPNSIDFFGVNYYSNAKIRINFPFSPWSDDNAAYPNESRTSNHAVIYPEGLYRSLMRAKTVGKPVIVTENGLADNDDTHKDAFIRKHLYALAKAQQDGCDVHGYYYWTLMDNFEWNDCFDQKFGLYQVDFDHQDKTRTLRNSAQQFVSFVQQQSKKP